MRLRLPPGGGRLELVVVCLLVFADFRSMLIPAIFGNIFASVPLVYLFWSSCYYANLAAWSFLAVVVVGIDGIGFFTSNCEESIAWKLLWCAALSRKLSLSSCCTLAPLLLPIDLLTIVGVKLWSTGTFVGASMFLFLSWLDYTSILRCLAEI